MTLGRTSSNAIKIKTDSPGLRAVECACCSECYSCEKLLEGELLVSYFSAWNGGTGMYRPQIFASGGPATIINPSSPFTLSWDTRNDSDYSPGQKDGDCWIGYPGAYTKQSITGSFVNRNGGCYFELLSASREDYAVELGDRVFVPNCGFQSPVTGIPLDSSISSSQMIDTLNRAQMCKYIQQPVFRANLSGSTQYGEPLIFEVWMTFFVVNRGCTNSCSPNHKSGANVDDGSCLPPLMGCLDYCSSNYNPNARCDDGSCTYDNANCAGQYGCTDPCSSNYNPEAWYDDWSCAYDNANCAE